MTFNCSYEWEDGNKESWSGIIDEVINYGNYFEVFITSRSSIHLIVGVYSRGIFAVSPNNGGSYLSSHLSDQFYNSEQLIKIFDNVVDGITAAQALSTLSSTIKLNNI